MQRLLQFINRDFFAEVWLKLTRYARGRAGGRTAATRAFIDTYLGDYLEVTGFVPPDFRYGQQTSLIEGAKIFTAYNNNVLMRLGSHNRQAVDHLLRIRQRKAGLIADRRREGLINALIKSEIYRDITEPATRFKKPIARRLPQDFDYLCLIASHYAALGFLATQPSIQKFSVKTFLVVGELIVKVAPWREFKGTIQTDGVGVTAIKKRMDHESRYTTRFAVVVERTQYISQEISQETVVRCVTINPGRRDLLFCVHENSTANNPNKFRFTKLYQDKFEKIKKIPLNPDKFEQYLVNRSNMTGIIQNHYVNFRTNHRTAHPLHRKLRLSAYFRRQQGNEDLIAKLDEQFGVEAVNVTDEEIVPRLWNCDMAACLNMVDIVRSLRAGNGIPARFSTWKGFSGPTEKSKDPK
ncbi:hypothetical protein INT47_007579 [Mucor saturninus]|uniref:Uncharacterized protein n=1 Tax=Mucor saturninus TaxID=64648 RepID=A0A8H7R9W1_9FUNG|nr:hypothetical protein INT47_007579 [Mucor saturninus]